MRMAEYSHAKQKEKRVGNTAGLRPSLAPCLQITTGLLRVCGVKEIRKTNKDDD